MSESNSLCSVCRGRGEVDAGLTFGDGRVAVRVVPNPNALINNEIWFVEENPLVALWGIAVCGRCRGSGYEPIHNAG
jgi:hypothetical protein